jgi:hypothetical protein
VILTLSGFDERDIVTVVSKLLAAVPPGFERVFVRRVTPKTRPLKKAKP